MISSYASKPVTDIGYSDSLRPINNPLERDIEIIRKLNSVNRIQSDLSSVEQTPESNNIFKSLDPNEHLRHKSLAPNTAFTAQKVREPHVIMIDLDVNHRNKDSMKQVSQFNSP
mmetsp:Transcript_20111/g.27175  ORF Transcript_20111/g.27175 Transcript_20111/m.27175 type:complete len:114 (+) Transcript_20111:1945-2286(+)|eukprot:CAMPEP_0185575626 /NCGR_PEP_ID=MMETSP0434-20130131/6768_1 /TAXON_ID=626734 ORGANISM="Favella taraikaensis, Strain Fe Narragansett Bay" /NCGR_SAMPLE_ID=MMETSP0434 /ASSEMBLY_ACC=CAM_ASM_000379 /LENGTH=113 /DNA_ID=CAMNT_0028192559 /DNA_START=1940 /DNA_END=2281 /DNA_ORIENTATION=+